MGDTVIAGYHHNTDLPPYPYFATQLELSNGNLTTWDPLLTGNQSNADGGNNGVQAMYVDQSTDTIYIAGAFDHYNNTFTHKSLIAFTFTPAAAHKPSAPTNVTASAGDGSATVNWSAPRRRRIADHRLRRLTRTPGAPHHVQLHGHQSDHYRPDQRHVVHLQGVGDQHRRDRPASAASNAVKPLPAAVAVAAVAAAAVAAAAVTHVTTPVRLAGADRFGTANATAAAEFPNAGSAGAVVLARADNYPDALVGTALAAAKNAPLLFVSGSLTPETQATIVHVLPAGGTVYLLGGTCGDSGERRCQPDRRSGSPSSAMPGADRYATALSGG